MQAAPAEACDAAARPTRGYGLRDAAGDKLGRARAPGKVMPPLLTPVCNEVIFRRGNRAVTAPGWKPAEGEPAARRWDSPAGCSLRALAPSSAPPTPNPETHRHFL